MKLLLAWAAAVMLWAVPAGPAAAEGIVAFAGPAGQAGWQMDVAAVSPAPPVAAPAGGQPGPQPTAYTVQPGDTLSGIAARLHVDAKQLAAANDIQQPDEIRDGQRLIAPPGPVAAAGPTVSLPPGSPLAALRFYPWPPVQGQTVTLWWRSTAPISPTVRLGDHAYPAVMTDALHGWALVPLNSLEQVGPARLAWATGQATVTLPFPITAGSFPSGEVPSSTSDPILSEGARVQAEAQRLAGLFGIETPGAWGPQSRFQSPLNGEFEHTSPFGTRRTYGGSAAISTHDGEDFAAPAGTPVLAPAAGTVALAETLFVRGNAVILDHGHGVYTGYWHMQRLDVKAGDRVEPGQKLGEVGTTGLSTGPHLHWELHVHGVAVDPLQWLAQK